MLTASAPPSADGISTASTWWTTPLERFWSRLYDRGLAARAVGQDDLAAVLGRGERLAAHRRRAPCPCRCRRPCRYPRPGPCRQDVIGEDPRQFARDFPASSGPSSVLGGAWRRLRRSGRAPYRARGRQASHRGPRPWPPGQELLFLSSAAAIVWSPAAFPASAWRVGAVAPLCAVALVAAGDRQAPARRAERERMTLIIANPPCHFVARRNGPATRAGPYAIPWSTLRRWPGSPR